MKHKFDVRTCILNFVAYISTQFHAKIKVIRCDNAMEFNMPSFYSNHGILHQTSCVETPQQNYIVEHKHRHLLNVTRTLLFYSKLSKCFWCYTLIHAIFFINRLPSLVII